MHGSSCVGPWQVLNARGCLSPPPAGLTSVVVERSSLVFSCGETQAEPPKDRSGAGQIRDRARRTPAAQPESRVLLLTCDRHAAREVVQDPGDVVIVAGAIFSA